MKPVYHLLSSNIPHHNHTLLRFFNDELAAFCPIFYVVSQENLAEYYPKLVIHTFPSQKAFAQAVCKQATLTNAEFILHGQFNPYLWLALLVGKLPAQRCTWHIWGADLYEVSSSWKFRLFYPIRRLAQRKIARIWATAGDLAFVHQRFKRDISHDRLLYFPTKLIETSPLAVKKTPKFTVLLGNSGDPSNRHLEGLAKIATQLGRDVNLLIPMGYPEHNHTYIEQVSAASQRYFSAENVHILTQKLPFEQYVATLASCDLGCFFFERQQGIGTMCLLIQQRIPLVCDRQNPFCTDLLLAKVPFLYADEISFSNIEQVKQQLALFESESLPFFASQYRHLWETRLAERYDS